MIVCLPATAQIVERVQATYDECAAQKVEALAPASKQVLVLGWPKDVPTLYDVFRSLPSVNMDDPAYERAERVDEDTQNISW